MRRMLVIALALGLVASGGGAQEGPATGGTPVWTGRIAAGAWLKVHDARGRIRVERAEGDVAQIVADVRGDAGAFTFDTIRSGQDVVVCARLSARASCTERGLSSDHDDHEDHEDDDDYRSRRSAVHLTVRLPQGVNLLASSGNGEVTVRGAGAEVIARSGNGDVEVVQAAGPVRASSGNGDVTVRDAGGVVSASTGNGEVDVSTAAGVTRASSGNGDVDVRMTALPADDMEFRTGNGSVTVTLPGSFQGELDAFTGSGEVQTDFAVTVRGALKKNRLRGTIGSGDRRLRIASGNGDIDLRRIE